MIKNKAAISPDIRMIRQRRSSHIMIKIIRRDPFRSQPRRILTKRNLKKVSSTFSGINCPRGGTINTRKHRKSGVPEQASWPIRLIQTHEIVKFRIFTNLDKRRKRATPQKMTIIIRSTTKPTRNRLTPHPTKKQTIPNTTDHDVPKQSLIPFSNMRRIKKLQRAMNIKQRTTTKTLHDNKSQQQPCYARHQE